MQEPFLYSPFSFLIPWMVLCGTFFQVRSIFFRENCAWQMILVLSFSRAPVTAAYNMFSPVNIVVYKNLPISFLKLRITGKSVVRYSFSSVVIRTQRTATIPMPSFRTSRHLQTEVHFRPAKPIISAQLPPYEIRQ